MSAPDRRLARTLEWVVRLPLLGDAELARLLGVGEPDARALRHALERRGWIDRVVVREPGLPAERLSFVREGALAELARLLDVGEAALAVRIPARRGELLGRIVRAGTTVRVNRFLAHLAAGPGAVGLELEDARSLPLSLRRSERWWPPGVEGYGCLRAGSLRAPFFVAWDPEGAPDVHRTLRARRWLSPPRAAAERWGDAGMPPVLLVGVGAGRESWVRALGRAAESAPWRRAAVLIADAGEVATAGPGAATWRDPGTGLSGDLADFLPWGPPPPLGRLSLAADPDDLGRPPPVESLGRRTALAATRPAAAAGERLAAIVIATDADEKALLGWIGRWPLLTAPQLASLASLAGAAVERRLPRLLSLGSAHLEAVAGRDGAAASGRLLLTTLGLSLLARRADVPERLYARHAGVIAQAVSEASAVRHRAHQLGLNRAAASLAEDARAAGGELESCRNEAQSTRRFRHEGRGAWVRPDGSGVLSLRGGRVPFLLEYDRGTLDSGDFRAKLTGYGRYYACRAWRRDFDAEPVLLFVCADGRAEERVARAARRAARDHASVPLLVTNEWRSRRGSGNPQGLLGPVWRSPAGVAPPEGAGGGASRPGPARCGVRPDRMPHWRAGAGSRQEAGRRDE
ncbi:MAG: replication-relaxation family protein [Chloroflexi bacterium]|nr:replication-relaxation family protein [Chloroflexota bacterium]